MKIKKKTWQILFLSGFLIAVSVSAFTFIPRWKVKTFDLENIPSTVSIDNTSVSMSCYLRRDYSLTTNLFEGHPLRCSITLSSNGSTDIFSDVIVSDFWVTTGNATWHRYLWPLTIPESNYQITNTTLKIIFRNGPDNDHWTVGFFVDVVVKVRYKSDVYYLHSTDVPIELSW